MPKRTSEIEQIISLAKCGPMFHSYAARMLLDAIRLRPELIDNHTLYEILRSAFNRHDWCGAMRFAVDWSDPYSLPVASISRFMPGQHFHVLDTKFDTLQEAEQYIMRRGYRRGQLHTVRVFCDGD